MSRAVAGGCGKYDVHHDSGRLQHPDNKAQKKILSSSQTFILAAFIHTSQPLPYQNEMVVNYLQVSHDRFSNKVGQSFFDDSYFLLLID